MRENFNPETIVLPEHLQERLFFTPKEFGNLIGVHQNTIYRWGQLGYLKLKRYSPRALMVPKSEVERYMRGEMMEDENSV
ncbi:MAG: helix-turn-helix domain-containing protein [Treponema sp.]|jgi:predicted site-specific integrase-resolvase|nr:helix-turn-helix domain-containing protein [Treponema sp.]